MPYNVGCFQKEEPMADQTDYKHIKVNAGAEDDVVIFAGASSEGADAASADMPSASVAHGNARAQAIPDIAASESASAAASASAEASASTAANVANLAGKDEGASKASESVSEYHETTLGDIQSSKMPKSQLVVIVCAVLAIAAFAVWYMFFMQ